ncbi:Magnesium transporter MRS2-I [Hibiscus syriacus]|uniref:Magnesium transporter MRS2-I n=1 Tax=Hibiscus syriacus TaxID=106335 RepID=A0A6A3AAA6_HIBSY|nr:Magnesium transporter MRS2-I [Hibiscus syriacus]
MGAFMTFSGRCVSGDALSTRGSRAGERSVPGDASSTRGIQLNENTSKTRPQRRAFRQFNRKGEVYLVPAAKIRVASVKKKTAVTTSWVSIDAKGEVGVFDIDKYAIMRRVQVHARDLRILDPMLSYPSTILGREKAIVLNLEHIKAIITAEEVLLRDPFDDNVIPIVAELKGRLPQENLTCRGQGEEEEEEHPGLRNCTNNGEENEFPFEFWELEVALEAICGFLDARTTELETDTYPALDELTSMAENTN